MKLGKFVLISAIAFCAVSCIEWLKNFGVDVDVNKQSQSSSTEFLGIQNEKNLDAQNSGEIAFTSEAEGTIVTSPITIPSSGSVKAGSLQIKIDDMPEIAKDAVIEPSQLFLTFDNPAEKPVKFTGNVAVGSENASFTVVVPAKTTGYKVVISKDANKEATGVDAVVAPSSDLGKILDKKPSAPLKLDIEISDAAKSAVKRAAADSYVFKIGGKLCIPFHFDAGQKIYIKHTLRDLGLNLADYDLNANSFDIYCSVTSSIPFDIACTGKAVNGVTAKTNNPIKAGTIANPVKTDVVISVEGARASATIEEVTLEFELTASANAKLNKNQSLKFDYSKIKVNILK